MKTIKQALIDEIYYPISIGLVENNLIKRGVDGDSGYDQATANSSSYKLVLADCLYSLIQAINFSEADKSISSLSTEDKKMILMRANELYSENGEPEKSIDGVPRVYIG